MNQNLIKTFQERGFFEFSKIKKPNKIRNNKKIKFLLNNQIKFLELRKSKIIIISKFWSYTNCIIGGWYNNGWGSFW